MSDVRRTHPGYFGVLMAIAVTWYGGLALTFLLNGDALLKVPSYKLVMHYVPAFVWGMVYLCVCLVVAVSSTVPRIPHRYARYGVAVGLGLSLFFLTTFIVEDVINGIPPATLIPAFATMVIVEFKALIEAEVNPLMTRELDRAIKRVRNVGRE